MKKVFWVAVIVGLSLISVREGHCWTWGKQKTTEEKNKTSVPTSAPAQTQVQQPPAAAPQPAAKPAKPRKGSAENLLETKRGALNNTQWDIDAAPLSGKGSKQQDVLVFRENKFSSEYFITLGFGASNYTLSVQEDGTAVFETMQTSEKEGIVFWRGECDTAMASCKGVFSRQLPGNKTEDYSFATTSKKPVLNTPPSGEGK